MLAAWADELMPEPNLSVDEWADGNLMLDDTTSAEPGRYRVDRTPYCREPMECLSATSPIQKVVLMWGAQLGKSTTGNAWAGYVIDNSPGPMLGVFPRVQDAMDYSRLRIEPMIAATPRLRQRVASKWTRDGGNTLATKKFPGGVLLLTGANSAAGLKSRPIRYLFLDEVDEYPWDVEDQGDPIALAVRRTNTFGHRRKILITSTPTIQGRSRVETEFEASDRRRYHVPCPECGELQVLVFNRLKWPKGKPEDVQYECEHCERRFSEIEKRHFLPAGQWIAEGEPGIVAGFHLPSWYSPLGWLSWREIALEWVEKHGDPNGLKTFVNTIMAETYEDRGESPPWQRLFDRREPYEIGTCPEGVVFVTVGVDVQKDRIEASIWGWGYDRESWLIDHRVFGGNIWNDETWEPVTELLHERFPGAGGRSFPVAEMAVDTGHAQDAVASWSRGVADRRVMMVKGDHWKNWSVVIGAPTKSEVRIDGKKTGLLLWSVGGALIKQETYGLIGLDTPDDGEPYPKGYVHLPMITREFCEQMVAEDLVNGTDSKGYPTRIWQKHRDRNEALDCRVYARAAAERHGLGRMVTGEIRGEPKSAPAAPEKSGGWMDRPSRTAESAKPSRKKPGKRKGKWMDR